MLDQIADALERVVLFFASTGDEAADRRARSRRWTVLAILGLAAITVALPARS